MRKLQVVNISQHAPHDFNFYARLVYTALLRSSRQRRSINKLSKYLRVSWKCVSNAKETLLSIGLAKLDKGKLVALRPIGELDGSERASWFYHLKNRPAWFESFMFFTLPVPSKDCPLDHRGCAVIGFLASLSKRKKKVETITYSYVSVNIGIDYRSVRAILLRLDHHGVVSHNRKATRDRFPVPVVTLEGKTSWFVERIEEKSEEDDIAPKRHSDIIHTTESNCDADAMEQSNDLRNPPRCPIGNDGRGSPHQVLCRDFSVTPEDVKRFSASLDGIQRGGIDAPVRNLFVQSLGCEGMPSLGEWATIAATSKNQYQLIEQVKQYRIQYDAWVNSQKQA